MPSLPRTVRVPAALLVLALLVTALVAVRPSRALAAPPTHLQVEARLEGKVAVVRSLLTDQASRPLAGAAVESQVLDSGAAAVTGADGWAEARIELPSDVPSGPLTVTSTYAGDQNHAGATAQALIQAGGSSVAGTTAAATTSAPTPAAPVGTRLAASLATKKDGIYPGNVLEVTGTLVDESGRPVTGAQVQAAFGGEPPTPAVLTDAKGAFRTLVTVPASAKQGGWNINVTFPGTPGLTASEARVRVNVAAGDSASSPPEQTPSEDPTADVSDPADDVSDARETIDPNEGRTGSATPIGGMPAFVVVLLTALGAVAVGGLVLLVALRARRPRSRSRVIDEPEQVLAPQDLPDPFESTPDTGDADAGVGQDTQVFEMDDTRALDDTQPFDVDPDARPPRRAL